MMKEFYLAVRKNSMLHLLLMIFSFFALLLLFVLFRFSIQTENYFSRINEGFESFEGMQIFYLNEGAEGNPVWDDKDGLERQQSFYYDTLSNNEFSISSVAIHPFQIDVNEFRGGEQFQQGYQWGENQGAIIHPEGWHFYVINSLKMNDFAWELLPMEIWSGRGLQAEDFNNVYTGEPLPVVLGYQYRDYYEVGDIIRGEFALVPFDLEVVGILAPNQVIFYDTPDYLVDNYMIMPFVSFVGEPQSREERDDWSIYYQLKAYFTHIFVEDTPEAINYMKNAIHTATNELNMSYFFALQDRTFIRHNELNNLIHHHADNVHILMIAVMILIIVITFILGRIKYQRRKSVYETKRLLGIPKYKQLLIIISENFIIYGVVIFIVLYYAIFYSDIVLTQDTVIWFRENNISLLEIFWRYVTFDILDFHHVALQSTALFGVFLFFLSIIYPTVQVQRLYKGRK